MADTHVTFNDGTTRSNNEWQKKIVAEVSSRAPSHNFASRLNVSLVVTIGEHATRTKREQRTRELVGNDSRPAIRCRFRDLRRDSKGVSSITTI